MDNFSMLPHTSYFGQTAENFILTELLKSFDQKINIYYWRTKTKQEVDFVVKHENKLIPIEIKSGQEKNIPDNLKHFINIYQPKIAYLLNWSTVKDIKFNDCIIKFRPLWFPVL